MYHIRVYKLEGENLGNWTSIRSLKKNFFLRSRRALSPHIHTNTPNNGLSLLTRVYTAEQKQHSLLYTDCKSPQRIAWQLTDPTFTVPYHQKTLYAGESIFWLILSTNRETSRQMSFVLICIGFNHTERFSHTYIQKKHATSGKQSQ